MIQKMLIVLVSQLLAASAMALQCDGIYQYVDENEKLQEKKAPLILRDDNAQMAIYATTIDQVYYEIQQDKTKDTFLVMVTLGPDYTKGVASRTNWDANNQMRVSRVDGTDVYKLSCKK